MLTVRTDTKRKDVEVMYRKKMSGKASRKLFSKTASKVKKKNYSKPMRGGIRM
jgi:U3 small nucleolar RNA-associated protein 14